METLVGEMNNTEEHTKTRVGHGYDGLNLGKNLCRVHGVISVLTHARTISELHHSFDLEYHPPTWSWDKILTHNAQLVNALLLRCMGNLKEKKCTHF